MEIYLPKAAPIGAMVGKSSGPLSKAEGWTTIAIGPLLYRVHVQEVLYLNGLNLGRHYISTEFRVLLQPCEGR